MLAHEVLEKLGQDPSSFNRQRSEELLIEIFEALSEGNVKFAGTKPSTKSSEIVMTLVTHATNIADILAKEKENL